MTRIAAATTLLICAIISASSPALSQSSAADRGCFPWQVWRNGQCVAKQVQEPPPLPPSASAAPDAPPAAAPPAPPAPPPPVVASPCLDGRYRDSTGECVCPAGMRADAANGRCLPEVITRARETTQTPETFVCDGGSVTNGNCVCPSGFSLMLKAGHTGGVCARTGAESCLGGQLTADGKCQCNGQVTMSGETYLLEYSNGKCLPMRCPVTALLRNGKCGPTPPATAPELASEPQREQRRPAREARDTREDSDEGEHGRRCGRGMVMTRNGCVRVHHHRNLHDLYRRYYRYY
jgi:hypothetical protein